MGDPTDFHERRKARRIAVVRHTPARARATLEVRLLDLSLTGARVEHLGLLRPGSPCVLELPAAIGPLVLSARVVRSTIVGAQAGLRGEQHLRYESGLMFGEVATGQQTALERILERLTPGGGLENVRLIL